MKRGMFSNAAKKKKVALFNVFQQWGCRKCISLSSLRRQLDKAEDVTAFEINEDRIRTA
jgi:hypothetical protein